MAAAEGNSNENVVNALISKGADIHRKDNYGRTALDIAENKKQHKLVELLKASIKANKPSDFGKESTEPSSDSDFALNNGELVEELAQPHGHEF